MPVCAPKFDSILASVAARCALKVIGESVVRLGMCSNQVGEEEGEEEEEEIVVYKVTAVVVC